MQELLALPMCFSHVVHQIGCCSAWLKVRDIEETGVEWSGVNSIGVSWRGVE